MHRLASKLIAIAPEHAGARHILGYQKVGTRWLTKAKAKRAAQKHARKIKAQIKRLYTRLSGSSESARIKARDQLIAMARSEHIPNLERKAQAEYTSYRDGWAAIRKARARTRVTGLLSVNLQYSKLTGLRTVPVSFGNGASGRIQLPTTRSISVGTTVAIPMGIR